MSFPRYPKYKPSGVEWLGEVPEHWSVARLKHLACEPIKNGLGAPSDTDDPAWPRYVRITDIAGPRALQADTFRSLPPEVAAEAPFEVGDILFACVGATYGKSYLHCSYIGPVCYAGYLARFAPAKSADSRFVSHWTQSKPYLAQLEANVIQSTVQNFSASKYQALELAVPPLFEQRAIAAFLDRETAKIDALVAEQERLIELLKEKRQAVISHAVTKGLDPTASMKPSGIEWLGDVPAHWTVHRVAAVTNKITNGYVGPTREVLVDDGVRYLQSLHIKDGAIDFHTPYYVTESWSGEHAKSILARGDVLVVQTGDIGQVAVVPDEYVGANCHALIILSPVKSEVLGEWLALALRSDYGRQSLLSIQTGALHPHLNCGDVRDVLVPIPPLEEQRKIIMWLSRRSSDDAALYTAAQQGIEILQERRSALISAAVTGQIDVRDAVPVEVA